MDLRRVGLAVAVLCASSAAPAVHAEVVIVKNDSFDGTGPPACVMSVAEGESMAARFTAPLATYPYRIDRIQVLTCGGEDEPYAVDVWQDDGVGVSPGALIWSSGAEVWLLTGSLVFQEIVPSAPVIVTGGTVRVALYNAAITGRAYFAVDAAILAQRNLLRTDTGVWQFAESQGVTGDFVLRLLVTPDIIFKDGF